jgi:enolase
MVQPPAQEGGGEAEARREVEEYLLRTNLESTLNKAVNDVISEMAEDPVLAVATRLRIVAPSARQISSVVCRCCRLAGALPAFEVDVSTGEGTFRGIARWPVVGDDEDSLQAADAMMAIALEGVHTSVCESLIGMDPALQGDADAKIVSEIAQLGLSDQAQRVVEFSFSTAVASAGAAQSGLRTCDHIASLMPGSGVAKLPLPSFTIAPCISLLPPFEAGGSISDCIAAGAAAHKAVMLESADEPLNVLERAIAAGARVVDSCPECRGSRLEVDVNGDELLSDSLYRLGEGREEDAEGMLLALQGWLERYPVATYANAFAKEHREAWLPKLRASAADICSKREQAAMAAMQEEQGADAPQESADPNQDAGEGGGEQQQHEGEVESESIYLGGDTSCCLQLALPANSEEDMDAAANTLVIKMGSSHTSTVTSCIQLASAARAKGWGIIVESASAGADPLPSDMEFAVHLAAGLQAGQVHGGSFVTSAHCAGLNELLRLEAQGLECVGQNFRLS